METSTAGARRSCWLRVGQILATGVLVWLVAVAMLADEVVTLTSSADRLHEEIVAAVGRTAERKVQLSVGPGTLAAARTVLRLVPDTPLEAIEAVKAVERASVGVYEFRHDLSPADHRRIFAAADHALVPQGWSRIVGVNNEHQTVVLYSPTDEEGNAPRKICLAVSDARQLVIVEGVIDGDRLASLAAGLRPRLALK